MPLRTALLLALLALLPPRALANPGQVNELLDTGMLCRAAIAQVEREAGTPPALLAAIARVESGRRDPQGGGVHPWPWTINAEGRGSIFPTRAAAIAGVQALQAQGVRSIDIGCMQINLVHHPNAFPSLDAAFDPLTNVRYGARFLRELQATRNDWMAAAGAYHSQTPERAEGYRALVAAAWNTERTGGPDIPSPALLAALRPAPFTPAPGGGGAFLSNRPIGASNAVQAIPLARGLAGRGLDAYRAAPVVAISGAAPRRL